MRIEFMRTGFTPVVDVIYGAKWVEETLLRMMACNKRQLHWLVHALIDKKGPAMVLSDEGA